MGLEPKEGDKRGGGERGRGRGERGRGRERGREKQNSGKFKTREIITEIM